jgi:hypothetical protein
MVEQWYYTSQGEQVGPVTEEQLRVLLASGDIASSEHVWREGTVERLSPRSALNLHFAQAAGKVDKGLSDEPPPLPSRKQKPVPGSAATGTTHADEPPPFPPSVERRSPASPAKVSSPRGLHYRLAFALGAAFGKIAKASSPVTTVLQDRKAAEEKRLAGVTPTAKKPERRLAVAIIVGGALAMLGVICAASLWGIPGMRPTVHFTVTYSDLEPRCGLGKDWHEPSPYDSHGLYELTLSMGDPPSEFMIYRCGEKKWSGDGDLQLSLPGLLMTFRFTNNGLTGYSYIFTPDEFPNIMAEFSRRLGCPPHHSTHHNIVADNGVVYQNEVVGWDTDAGLFELWKFAPKESNRYNLRAGCARFASDPIKG